MALNPVILVHGSNLLQKENHKTKYRDTQSKEFLKQIRLRYDEWHKANIELRGPTKIFAPDDEEIIVKRVKLFEDYKGFLDQKLYAEKFDSRSNLHSSVLEEFLYYLFKDMVAEFGGNALIGKSHSFKDIFFAPPGYTAMLNRPYARIEKKDHDFVIGATVQASFQSDAPIIDQAVKDEFKDKQIQLEPGHISSNLPTETILTKLPDDHDAVEVVGNTETHLFDIPAVAIECKTYLDKTMLEGSSRAAEELKARNPNGLYIVVMEWIKLTEAVNLRKYKVDQIYVMRKQKNTDREFRLLDGYVKNSVDPKVVQHLFLTVRKHLTTDWTAGLEYGIQRGWLIE